jgi:hypothetical protein
VVNTCLRHATSPCFDRTLCAGFQPGDCDLRQIAHHPDDAAILAGTAAFVPAQWPALRSSRGILRVARIAVLALAVGGIFEGYRFVVFLITVYSTT